MSKVLEFVKKSPTIIISSVVIMVILAIMVNTYRMSNAKETKPAIAEAVEEKHKPNKQAEKYEMFDDKKTDNNNTHDYTIEFLRDNDELRASVLANCTEHEKKDVNCKNAHDAENEKKRQEYLSEGKNDKTEEQTAENYTINQPKPVASAKLIKIDIDSDVDNLDLELAKIPNNINNGAKIAIDKSRKTVEEEQRQAIAKEKREEAKLLKEWNKQADVVVANEYASQIATERYIDQDQTPNSYQDVACQNAMRNEQASRSANISSTEKATLKKVVDYHCKQAGMSFNGDEIVIDDEPVN